MMPVRIHEPESYAHKFSAVDIFWNSPRRQAISPIVKSHHMLRPRLMIQPVDIEFYHTLLSQSELTILNKSIIPRCMTTSNAS